MLTGNIYGIYDMSGGSWEYTASYLNNSYADDNGKIISDNHYLSHFDINTVIDTGSTDGKTIKTTLFF